MGILFSFPSEEIIYFSFIIVLSSKNFKPFYAKSYQTPQLNSIIALPQFKPYQDKQTYNSHTLTYALNKITTQKMSIFRNKVQSNSKLNREGNYEAGQRFNLPRLNFSQEQA